MNSADINGSPEAMVDRLVRTTNAHDLDGLADCFAVDYVNHTPAHPARGFTGREQVRTNWRQIFSAVPDLRVTVLRTAVADDTIWGEWEMSGTRLDGAEHLMRGVIVFGVAAGRAAWARLYLEPVQEDGANIDSAVATQLSGRR